MTSSLLHPGWERLTRLPRDVVTCPRCNAPQTHRDHNWRWDEGEERWLCRRASCMEPGVKQRVNPWMKRYPPVPH